MNATRLAIVGLALALASGCSNNDRGSAKLSVSVAALSTVPNVDTITVVADMAGQTELSVNLTLDPTTQSWTGTMSHIPAGDSWVFTGTAYGNNVPLYAGSSPPVAIVAQQTSTVLLELSPLNPPPTFGNHAPHIDSIYVSNEHPGPNDLVQLVVGATDPDTGDQAALAYAWTGDPGETFTAASSATTDWSANADGHYNLSITATDPHEAFDEVSFAIDVAASNDQGAADISISFNEAPQVIDVVASTGHLQPGVAVNVIADATDDDPSGLTYTWDDDCDGSFFPDPTLPNTSNETQYTPGNTGAASCTVTVTVTDAQGLVNTGSLTIVVSDGTVARLAFTTQPSASATAGVAFAQQPVVQAIDSDGNFAIDFAGSVTLAAYSDPACASAADGALSFQSNPISASGGQAAFAAVAYDGPGLIYLGASTPGAAMACSSAIAVSATMTLTAGTADTCALKDGDVKCWGFNSSGTLGNGTNNNASTPQQVTGLSSGVLTLGGGGQHSCASTATGLLCWGLNAGGQLGDGTTTNRNVPVSVTGIAGGVSQIVGGDSHTCVLLNGSVSCWGDNTFGQLGTGSNSASSTAVAVQGLPDRVRSIAAGPVSTCAVLVTGDAYCWGFNDYGQLGDGTTQDRNLPVRVEGLGLVNAIAPGVEHSCALVGDQVYCWGRNSFGQLGTGDLVDSLTPRLVQGLTGGVATLLSGGQNFNCAIVAAGGVQCWGQDLRGQLGDNRVAGSQSAVPVQVVGLTSGITALHAGYIHGCASDGTTISCWGWGSSGQLGNGASVQSNVPVAVTGY